ncbi:type II toxin-antitoxin system HicA family toxin [Marinobacter alkaliphilus]|uniref:Type II toxin-antitoxin system HicA family toxin n=1 Tax=Marinobacter alkaliphilus TaxID=254719 RepID=A0ABZ3E8I2_9GAMM
MGNKQDKFAAKLKRKPTPKDIKWRELQNYLESLGFEELQGSGSRVKYFLPEAPDGDRMIISLHNPHPSPDVKPGAIDAVVKSLKERGLLK